MNFVPMFLSVDPTGTVSLWDSAEEREEGKQPHEISLDLDLTDEQETAIIAAAKLSRAQRSYQRIYAGG